MLMALVAFRSGRPGCAKPQVANTRPWQKAIVPSALCAQASRNEGLSGSGFGSGRRGLAETVFDSGPGKDLQIDSGDQGHSDWLA